MDFRDILKAQTYDAKVNRNINVSGLTIPAVHREQAANPAAAKPESGTSDLSSGNTVHTRRRNRSGEPYLVITFFSPALSQAW